MATFWCAQCRTVVQLVKLATHVVHAEGEYPVRYVFGHCAECIEAGLVKQLEVSDGVWGSSNQLVPSRPGRDDLKLPTIAKQSSRLVVPPRWKRLTR